jgi:hypothetical protein
MGGACSTHGIVEKCKKILVGKPERERPLWEMKDNIKMNLEEIGSDDVDWMHLFQSMDQWWVLVDTAIINFRLP